MKKFISTLGVVAAGLLPLSVLAQIIGGTGVTASGTQVTSILTQVLTVLNIVMPIVLGLGVIYFIWGVVQYVTAKDEEKKKEGRGIMIMGIIGIFIIASIWGLVALIAGFTGVGQGGGISNPYTI